MSRNWRPGQAAAVLEQAQRRGLLAAALGAVAAPKTHEDRTQPKVQRAKPERHKAPALERAGSGEATSVRRTVVRFIGYRVRPLDPDNFAGGCKDLLDGLRHAQLISGDEPWRIVFETEQRKVSTFKEERTVIEIEQ